MLPFSAEQFNGTDPLSALLKLTRPQAACWSVLQTVCSRRRREAPLCELLPQTDRTLPMQNQSYEYKIIITSALLQPLLSFPVWAVRWSLSTGSRSSGALTLLRHRKPISTLQFTAAAVGEQPVFKKKITQPFLQSLQRKCSMKLSSIPLLLFSSSLPVGWMSPRKRLLPNGFLLQIHWDNTKRL